MPLKTEEELIRTAQKGGERGREAFGKIYEHYHSHLERFFRARLGNNPEVEDLVSEVFKKALLGIDSFRWQGLSLSAWLYKISKNVLTDYFRESGRIQTVSLKKTYPLESKIVSPEELYIANEKYELLHQLLAALPKRERKIIYLKFFEGRTNKAIAKDLNLSETNVRTNLYRVLRKLRPNILRNKPF